MSGNHESSRGEESAEDQRLFHAVDRNNAAAVRRALQDGGSVSAVRYDSTLLMIACTRGNAEIVGILLDAGADARCKTGAGKSAFMIACNHGHVSTVQLLINHDNGLLEIADNHGWTPLFYASSQQRSDVARFLLDSGADPHHVDQYGLTTLMRACQRGSLEIVRLLLAAGVQVEARDSWQRTALHHAAHALLHAEQNDSSEIIIVLILQHNANMFASQNGRTPFDFARNKDGSADILDFFLEMYGNKLTQDHGRYALHELLKAAEYLYAIYLNPPLNRLQIILPLGKLTLQHLRTLLHTLDPELIRNRDDTGKLPIHIACRTNAPVEVLALIVELDPAVLHIADSTGALPIHLLCGSSSTTTTATEYATVRYLVEQGGVGTLAARNQQGLLPLHVLCGSTNPPLRAVQYLIQSFPGSVEMQTNAGHYPFMMAAAAEVDAASASLSVVYELVRANPGLIIPR